MSEETIAVTLELTPPMVAAIRVQYKRRMHALRGGLDSPEPLDEVLAAILRALPKDTPA